MLLASKQNTIRGVQIPELRYAYMDIREA